MRGWFDRGWARAQPYLMHLPMPSSWTPLGRASVIALIFALLAVAILFPGWFSKVQVFATAIVAFIASIIAYQSAQEAARTQAETATAVSRMQINAALTKEREQDERIRRHVLVRLQTQCLAYMTRLRDIQIEIEIILGSDSRKHEGRGIHIEAMSLIIGRLRHSAEFAQTLSRDAIGLVEFSLVDNEVQFEFYILVTELLEVDRSAKSIIAVVDTRDLLTVAAVEMFKMRCDTAEHAAGSAKRLLDGRVARFTAEMNA